MEETATDILNQPLQVGDVIAYPVRQSSNMNVHFGKIYSLEWTPPETLYSNYVRPGYWICKIIIVSENFYYVDRTYTSPKDVEFIRLQILSGLIPENLDSCYICKPKKTNVGLNRAIKINPDHLSDDQKKVMLDEIWQVTNIRLK